MTTELKDDVAVLIVAYNEAKNISHVLSDIPDGCTVYVVDDGSGDGTAEIARDNGARVIPLPVNLGQGAAVIAGYRTVAMEGHEYLVKMDGDGQHDPAEIPLFIKALKETGSDTVIGSRILGTNYKEAPLMRRIFLGPLTALLNRLTGYNLTDSMCGFRAFRGDSLREKVIPVLNEIIEPEYMASEMWIRFSRVGIKVGEVPINLRKRKHGVSYKGMFRYGVGVVTAILRSSVDIARKK